MDAPPPANKEQHDRPESMNQANRLKALANAGVSIWLDDLSRERINSGNLAGLVADSGVVGVTTNPTIFAAALAKGEAYAVAPPEPTSEVSGGDRVHRPPPHRSR